MHQDEGHYAGKHPGGSTLNEDVAAVLRKYVMDGRISCGNAHAAAMETGVSPAEAGRTLDLIEVRISSCQLGLFGCKNREKSGLGVPKNKAAVLAEVKQRIQNGSITCFRLWEAADVSGCTKMEASAVCEKEGIKITGCQLGAF